MNTTGAGSASITGVIVELSLYSDEDKFNCGISFMLMETERNFLQLSVVKSVNLIT